jgi:hypothetical protein
MAKRKQGVNKSQAIREFLQHNAKATAQEVVDALGAKNIAVKPGLVYIVKGKMLQIRSHKKQKAARVARAGQKTGSTDPVALILRIKALAVDAGGMDNLKMLVSVLAE